MTSTAPVAQPVEQRPRKTLGGGSIPSGGSNFNGRAARKADVHNRQIHDRKSAAVKSVGELNTLHVARLAPGPCLPINACGHDLRAPDLFCPWCAWRWSSPGTPAPNTAAEAPAFSLALSLGPWAPGNRPIVHGGETSLGQSRCLDLLDSDQTHADRVAPEETANPGPSCRVSSSPGRTGAQP